MRIENDLKFTLYPTNSQSTFCYDPPSTLKSLSPSSGDPSCFYNYFSYVKRGVFNFFRKIFSCCFSIKERESIKKDEIKYKKIDEGDGKFSYNIFVNGFETKNKLVFQRKDKKIEFVDFNFEEEALMEHCPMILDHVCKEENTTRFRTTQFDLAEILWRWGLATAAIIHYNPEGRDEQNQRVKEIIELAQSKRKLLNSHYTDALNRIEEKIKGSKSVKDICSDFVDLAASKIELSQIATIHLSVEDLFILDDLNPTPPLKRRSFSGEAVDFQFKNGEVSTDLGGFQQL